MANATLRDLSAATDIAATDVLVIQNTDSDGAYYKITGTNFAGALESGGGIELSLAAAQVPAAGADTRVQYNNGGARGGDAEVTWDNSGKALTVGAVTVTTQLILPQANDPGTPTLAFGDGDSGLYEQSDDVIRFATGGGGSLIVGGGRAYMYGSGAFRGGLQDEAASNTNPTLTPRAGDQDTGFGRASSDVLSLPVGGVNMFNASEQAQDAANIRADPLPPRMSSIVYGKVPTSFMTFVIDEDNNELEFWVKYSDGTAIKSGAVALA
jgi:hypothetical protein